MRALAVDDENIDRRTAERLVYPERERAKVLEQIRRCSEDQDEIDSLECLSSISTVDSALDALNHVGDFELSDAGPTAEPALSETATPLGDPPEFDPAGEPGCV